MPHEPESGGDSVLAALASSLPLLPQRQLSPKEISIHARTPDSVCILRGYQLSRHAACDRRVPTRFPLTEGPIRRGPLHRHRSRGLFRVEYQMGSSMKDPLVHGLNRGQALKARATTPEDTR